MAYVPVPLPLLDTFWIGRSRKEENNSYCNKIYNYICIKYYKLIYTILWCHTFSDSGAMGGAVDTATENEKNVIFFLIWFDF